MASCPTPRCVVPRTRPSKNSSWARVSNARHSTIVRYIRRRRARSAGAAVAMLAVVSVLVRDEELGRREPGDDLRPLGCHDHLFLDPGGAEAVLRRAVRLEGDDHARLDLVRMVERIQAADDRALVEKQAHAVAELEA